MIIGIQSPRRAAAMRVAKTIELDADAERELRALSRSRRSEVRLQQRASIVLMAAKGMQNKDIAIEVGLDRRRWPCGASGSSKAGSTRFARMLRVPDGLPA